MRSQKTRIRFIVAGLGIVVMFLSFGGQELKADQSVAIIPQPAKLEVAGGIFRLNADAVIGADGALRDEAERLAVALRAVTGLALPVRAMGDIQLRLDSKLGPEAYRLSVRPKQVVVESATGAGAFYAGQTLRQLVPVNGWNWNIPCVEVEDAPRFVWRGMMLDVARHFFSKAEIKQYLDAMAFHKLNTFHWHLTDHEGWRIEIKSHPELTTLGAWRDDIGWKLDPKSSAAYGPDGRYGGYYTQDDIREIVDYAAARHINIVPEIEMPGHSRSAGHMELRCSQLCRGIFCAGNDEVFLFLKDVLTEVCGLFPGQYVHIGGDEVHKQFWEKCPRCQARIKAEGLKDENGLQSYFLRRIERIVNANGKTMVGWSEIRLGGIPPNAVLMDWIGGSVEAARGGHDVVLAPAAQAYFNKCQSFGMTNEPNTTETTPLLLSQVYAFEPVPVELEPQFRNHVLGLDAPLWTEETPNLRQLEYMIYPRACALAEVGWTPVERKDYDAFLVRLATHLQRLDALHINYRSPRPEPKVVGGWTAGELTKEFQLKQCDVTRWIKSAGAWTVLFQANRGAHSLNIQSVQLLANGTVVAADTHDGTTGLCVSQNFSYTLKLPFFDPKARYTLQFHIRGIYGSKIPQSLKAEALTRFQTGVDSNGDILLGSPEG